MHTTLEDRVISVIHWCESNPYMKVITSSFIHIRLMCRYRTHSIQGIIMRFVFVLITQNATARLITGTRRRDHITPVLCELRCMAIPIRERVKFTVAYVWFASRCPGRRLSTRQMIAASCLTALGALYGQLTFRLAWCREHNS